MVHMWIKLISISKKNSILLDVVKLSSNTLLDSLTNGRETILMNRKTAQFVPIFDLRFPTCLIQLYELSECSLTFDSRLHVLDSNLQKQILVGIVP